MASAGQTIAAVTIQAKDQASAPLKNIAEAAGEVRESAQGAQRGLGTVVPGPIPDVADSMEDAAKTAEHLGEASGKVGGSATKLAGALGMVSPEAGQLAMGLADLADVGEVASAVSTALGVSLGELAMIAGPITIAIGALALAWKVYSDELEAAEAKQASAAKKLEEFLPLAEMSKQSQRDLAMALGTMTQAEADEIEVRKKYEAQLASSTEELRKNREETAAALAEQKRLVSEGSASRYKEVDALTESLATQDAELERNRKLTEQSIQTELEAKFATRARAEAEKQEAENQRKREEAASKAAQIAQQRAAFQVQLSDLVAAGFDVESKATYDYEKKVGTLKTQADKLGVSLTDLAPVLAHLNAEFQAGKQARAFEAALADATAWAEAEFRPTIDKSASVLADFSQKMESIVPSKALTDMERLTLLEASIQTAFDRGTISAGQYADATKQLADARNSASKAAETKSVTDAVSMASQATQSPEALVSTIGGAFGGLGSAVATGVNLVASAGEGSLKKLETGLVEYTTGLGNAGEAIGQFVGDAVGEVVPAALEAIPELFKGLMDSLPGVFKAIAGAIPEILVDAFKLFYLMAPEIFIEAVKTLADPQVWLDIGKAFMDALLSVFDPIFGKGKDGKDPGILAEGGWADSLFYGTNEKGYKKKGIAEEGGFLDRLFGGVQDDPKQDWFRGTHATGSDGVTRSGLAMVHQGERIIPADGAASGRSMALMDQSGGGEVHIHVNSVWPPTPAQVDGLVKEINRALGANGRRLGWVT